jgi:ribonuclease I
LSLNEIIENEFRLSEEDDASGLGVEMQWMTADEQLEEAFNFYPGIAALKKQYIPIGKCLQGSGDPYFTKEVNNILEVYRIPHESVFDGEIDESQIEYVCHLNELIAKNAV